jgi:hypothetical protein
LSDIFAQEEEEIGGIGWLVCLVSAEVILERSSLKVFELFVLPGQELKKKSVACNIKSKSQVTYLFFFSCLVDIFASPFFFFFSNPIFGYFTDSLNNAAQQRTPPSLHENLPMPFYNPYKTQNSAAAPQPQQQQYPPQRQQQHYPQQQQQQQRYPGGSSQQPQQQYQSGQHYPQQQQQQQPPQFRSQRQPSPQQQQPQQQFQPPQQQYQPQQYQQQPQQYHHPQALSPQRTGSPAQAKTGIWAKLKNQITVVTTSGETDGLTPDDTVISHALVKFYTEQKPGTIMPGWLRGSSNAVAGGGDDGQGYTAPPPLQSRSTSSLQEIYNRRSNNSVQSMPSTSGAGSSNGSSGSAALSWRAQQHPTSSSTGTINSASAERYKSKLRSAQRPSMESTGGSYSGSSTQSGQASRPSWSSNASWS